MGVYRGMSARCAIFCDGKVCLVEVAFIDWSIYYNGWIQQTTELITIHLDSSVIIWEKKNREKKLHVDLIYAYDKYGGEMRSVSFIFAGEWEWESE